MSRTIRSGSSGPKMKLNSAELEAILLHKHVFLRAEQMVSVPWELMAAIWYRESFSVQKVRTPGGPFQFDPPDPSMTSLRQLLQRFAKGAPEQLEEIAQAGVDDFAAACVLAACKVRLLSRFDLSKDKSDEAVKDAFYGYNGRAWGAYPERSPYVMNNYDSLHLNMRIRGTVPRADGGRRWVDVTDMRPGAFVVYKQLRSLGWSIPGRG